MIARVLTSRRTGAIRSPAPITHPVRDTAFHGLPSHMATCTEHDNIHRKSPTNASDASAPENHARRVARHEAIDSPHTRHPPSREVRSWTRLRKVLTHQPILAIVGNKVVEESMRAVR